MKHKQTFTSKINYLYPVLIFMFILLSITFYAINNYIGETYILIIFTITSNLLLYFGFRKNAIFFDTFIGVFLWLGFWLKTMVRIIFLDNKFSEGLANFIISGDVFDKALLISSIGFIALIFASYIREKLFFSYSHKEGIEKSSIFILYKNHRKKILLTYVILFVFIAWSNIYFGIYQRGELTKIILPFGLNGVYKWLLLFGIASFASLILKYEFALHKKATYLVPILTLLETSVTNISLLSRGMVLNGSALGFGMIKDIQVNKIKSNMKFWLITIFSFIILFFISVVLVNNLRHNTNTNMNMNMNMNMNSSVNGVEILFLDRWVGIEGTLAVVSSDRKGWSLLKEALSEKYDENKTSFYDLNLIDSPYINLDTTKHHYISLPGFIAFFYYANSIPFLFVSIFLLALFAATIEYLAYRLSNKNLIFASLIAQVIAYRYTHFGYVPAQSYLLFGAIFLNIFLIYGLNKILSIWYKR